jgi:hypothetical protein
MVRGAVRFTTALAIAAVLHVSVADIVLAQSTSQEMRDAAALANTGTFKPGVADLYSSDGSSVTITGVTSGGAPLTLGPADLYYGVTGQSAADGALPAVTGYDQLYGYRDEALGQLENGTGRFNATGALNAEAAAIELLRGSMRTPSVAGQSWLTPGRDLLTEADGGTAEFGECIIRQETGEIPYTYDGTTTETCDTLAIDTTATSATRAYTGPSDPFVYVVSGGVAYCQKGGVSIRTDGPETCGKLSILQSTPTSPTGLLQARGCAGSASCFELVLKQRSPVPPNSLLDAAVSMSFVVNPTITVTSASVVAQDISDQGFLTYQGNTLPNPAAVTQLPQVLTTRGTPQVIGVYGHQGRFREPPSGFHYSSSYRLVVPYDEESSLYWAGTELNRPYYDCDYEYRLRDIDYDTDYNRTFYYSVARTCGGNPTDATATLRVEFSAATFGPWAYNPARWSEMQAAAASGFCSIGFTTRQTATKPNGCVNAYVGSPGRAGEICGADIPVAPFDAFPDRGATNVEIRLDCRSSGVTDGQGNAAFTQSGTCQELQARPDCTFLSRACGHQLSNGSCLYNENTYSCGAPTRYTSPTYREVNICNSSLSCMGEDCILNSGTDGAVDLADAAAKLAAVDMLLTDMSCSVDPSGATAEADMQSCQLFQGEAQSCKKVALGLANCCRNASGVNMADYIQLAFAVSRVARTVEGTAFQNPLTSAWAGLEDMTRNSFSELTRPLTEAWDSIIGNSGVTANGAGAVSVEAIKQTMMRNAAQWTANVFGDQAANAIFQINGGAAVGIDGLIQPGTIGLTQGAASVMSAVMTAYTIYVLVNVLVNILFACTEGEAELQVRKTLKSTHEIGTYCSTRFLGACITKRTMHCMFNSPLSRIFNEQARSQLGMSWGTPEAPNCQGISLAQFQNIDMERIDLSEWTGILVSSGMLDMGALTDIDRLTGDGSTLGRALEGLYDREDAITRNTGKLGEKNLDAARQDAVNDFGTGVTD